MSKATVTVTVKATVEAAFDFVAEPSNTPRFMNGITRYEPIGDQSRGKGARFDSRAVVAGKHFDVELEVTGWKDNERMVATSRKGPKTQGTWSFEEFDDGTTDVTLIYEYELPMIFKFVPGVNGIIEGNLEKSLQKLKRLLEAEPAKPRPVARKATVKSAAKAAPKAVTKSAPRKAAKKA
ncbi:MAG: SRPBCC family protein [Candidatus Dormibacteria bacterium]